MTAFIVLVLIGALPDLNISRERQLGFEAANKAHTQQTGLAENKPMVVGYGEHFDRESGREVFEDWIAKGTVPDAIVTMSYTLLEGVLDVMVEKPELINQVKLATFGDNRLLDFLPFKVHSLPQQFEVIADSAFALALNASAKRYQAGIELVPRSLVKRG